MKEIIRDPNAPTPSGPYSSAVVGKGNLVFLAGQIGRDPASGKMQDGIEAQTRQALENMQSLLAASGAGMEDVCRVLVFLANTEDAPTFNKVYGEYFSNETAPVRTRVTAELSSGLLVEMEAIAVLPS